MDLVVPVDVLDADSVAFVTTLITMHISKRLRMSSSSSVEMDSANSVDTGQSLQPLRRSRSLASTPSSTANQQVSARSSR